MKYQALQYLTVLVLVVSVVNINIFREKRIRDWGEFYLEANSHGICYILLRYFLLGKITFLAFAFAFASAAESTKLHVMAQQQYFSSCSNSSRCCCCRNNIV